MDWWPREYSDINMEWNKQMEFAMDWNSFEVVFAPL